MISISKCIKAKHILDAGCGDMPYRELFELTSSDYETLDIEKRSKGVDFIGDVQDMPMIESGKYDIVLCLNVLEHLQQPLDALREINRVLKPGGTAIITVPFLARIHEAPHDYFRFTRFGLEQMLDSSGLSSSQITTIGGIGCFLGHQLSTGMLLPFWSIPALKWVFFLANAVCITIPFYVADKILPNADTFPAGYFCAAQKKE